MWGNCINEWSNKQNIYSGHADGVPVKEKIWCWRVWVCKSLKRLVVLLPPASLASQFYKEKGDFWKQMFRFDHFRKHEGDVWSLLWGDDWCQHCCEEEKLNTTDNFGKEVCERDRFGLEQKIEIPYHYYLILTDRSGCNTSHRKMVEFVGPNRLFKGGILCKSLQAQVNAGIWK